MINHGFQRFFFVVAFLLAVGAPAFAEVAVRPRVAAVRPAAHAVVFAGVGNIGSLITGGGRTRVVQVCVVVVVFALFIMMRKLNG